MPNPLQVAGAALPPSDFAPLHVNRMTTGLYTNSNPLRDAATSAYEEKFYGGKQDRIVFGQNCEVSPRLTLWRRPGNSVYNTQIFPRITRFYGWNTFTLTDEAVRLMVDTNSAVYDGTGPNRQDLIWQKSSGAGSTYFLGVGNTLYFTNGVDNKQLDNATGIVSDWGIDAPTDAPSVTQMPRPNNYALWQANTVYGISSPARSGIIILDDSTVVSPGPFAIIPVLGGGNLCIGCGMNLSPGASIPLPTGFDNTRIAVWSTPGTGAVAGQIDGVYASNNSGGSVTSSLQNRGGGSAGVVPSNWIATAWDTASAPHITVSSSGGYTTLVFKTANGDDLAIVVGSGYRQSTMPIPSGFTTADMLTMTGMVGADSSGNGMQGIFSCESFFGSTVGELDGSYCDNSAHLWFGTVGVFAVLWKPGQGTSTQAVANGTTLTIPTGGTNNVVMTFVPTSPSGTVFGLPPGYTTANTYITTAMVGWTSSGSNVAHGWTVGVSGTTLVAFYSDGSGNNWNESAKAFAIGSTSAGTGGNLEWFGGNGTTGSAEPSPWGASIGDVTVDGTVSWVNLGPWPWQPNTNYPLGAVVVGAVATPAGMPNQVYVATTGGTSGASQPAWPGGPNLQVQDGSVTWTCEGRILAWADIGANTAITSTNVIADPNGFLQQVNRAGKSGTTEPSAWETQLGAITDDGTMRWTNIGPYAPQGTAAWQYGYAYASAVDISEMSPASPTITVTLGNQVTVQGQGSGDPQVTTIYLYRTAQGGSTFLLLATLPNPGAGQTWTYIDNKSDDDLNTEIQAQVNGEGTPLPAGATCLAYHVGRIFAAVGNVVWVSSGPDAIASTSSGNAGFDQTFTAQSKITRFWGNSLGVVVFTVRDAYIILGSGTPNDPLYMTRFIENIPLLNYDAFTTLLSTAYLLSGQKMVLSLDPSAGITEASFPIADVIENGFDPNTAYVTFHTGGTGETALYVSDGATQWYRMAPTSAPESGLNWSPQAVISQGISAVQSVEINPGETALLVGPSDAGGPILRRDINTHLDNGIPYSMSADYGSIVLAPPSQLAALAWMTLECMAEGNPPTLGVLLDELSGEFESVPRSRQDPTILPPSTTLFSNRHSLLQGQQPVWCRHLRFHLEWPQEDAPNELLTYTIFGQTWQEQRSQ